MNFLGNLSEKSLTFEVFSYLPDKICVPGFHSIIAVMHHLRGSFHLVRALEVHEIYDSQSHISVLQLFGAFSRSVYRALFIVV